MDWLTELNLTNYQLWLILGGILLICELLGTAGYLLWSGIAALIIGALVWLVPLSWPWQWILFSLLTLIIWIGWWYWQRNTKDQKISQKLNQPSSYLIGTHTKVIEPIINGLGRVKIADGSWRAKCSEDLPAGTTVQIIQVESNTLYVRPVNPT